MRNVQFILLVGTALWASPALSADALKYGGPPAWVVQQSIPAAKPSDAPVVMLLNDQQIAFDQGKITTYGELAFKIQNPTGLQAGNLSIVWQPSTDTVTVNKLQIRRGDKVIDVLGSGQTFNVLRRETNLEAATLDGTLTASILPEDLREGDIIDFATTTERSDPVLKGHFEASFASWNGLPLQAGHARVSWPAEAKVGIRKSDTLPAFQRSTRGGRLVAEVSAIGIEPLVPPKNVPTRYKIGRLGEASDFASWSDVSRLMLPLFRQASVIPASGPLREELEKIRSGSNDPKVRAAQALALVENRVRYVALLMGQGGYVPASAEQTWSRRFGDCKAKTALLLGLLHELGVQAEPILVNSEFGDALSDRLPMLGLFDHVLVRAHIAGKDYWLDGTRTGDTSLDDVPVPDFGWVLPLVDNAALVHVVPPPSEKPDHERHVDVDATGGVFAPAPVTVTEIYRGDSAVALNILYSTASAEQRDQALRESAKGFFDSFEFGSSALQFDKSNREFTLVTRGRAKLAWDDGGWLYVPTSSIAFDPDFDRPAGALHDVPVEVGHPSFVRDIATIKLPRDFALGSQRKLPNPVHETLAGVEYARTETVKDSVLTVESSERSIVPEIPYKDALAAKPRLKSLSDDDVYIRLVDNYRPTQTDLLALSEDKPVSKEQFFRRGLMFSNAGRFNEAIGDFSEALKLDPRDIWTLANRGIAYAWKRDFDKAERDIQAASAIDPQNAANLRAAGFLAELQNQPAKAVDFYTRSLERDPRNGFAIQHRALAMQMQGKTAQAISELDKTTGGSVGDALLLATSAYSKAMLGKYDEAEKDLKAAEAFDPTLPSALGVRAMIAEGRHDYKTAVEVYSKVLKAAPNDPYTLLHRGMAYRALGDNKNALADSEAALKGAQNTSEVRLLRANIFKAQGNRDAAVVEADLMTRENLDSEYAFVAAGRIYGAFGLNDRALKAFDRALELKTESYIYVNRAQVRPAADDAGRMADLDAAIKLDPYNADALGMKASELTKTGQYASALELFDRALAITSDDGGLTTGKAIAMFKSGKDAEAEKLLSNVRAKAKTGDDFLSLCSRAAKAGVLLEEALQDCRQAERVNPSINTDEEGFVLLRLGRTGEAVQALTKAVDKTHSAFSYMARAIAFQREGDKARAAADRTEALKRDGDIEARLASYGVKF